MTATYDIRTLSELLTAGQVLTDIDYDALFYAVTDPTSSPASKVAAWGLVAGLLGQPQLKAGIAVGATACSLDGLPKNATAGAGWLVFSPYTSTCEIRQWISGPATMPGFAALGYDHAQGDQVLFMATPAAYASWFGAGPGIDAATNSVGLQRAFNEARGAMPVIFGPGTYSYNVTLTYPDGGLKLEGASGSDDAPGTILQFTGLTGDAIEPSGSWTSGTCKISISNVAIIGSGATGHGLDLTGNSKYVLGLDKVRISGFTAPGKYGLTMANVYVGEVTKLDVTGCNSAVGLSGVVVELSLNNCWLRNMTYYGLDVNLSSGIVHVRDTIVDSPSAQPSTQIGLYVRGGGVRTDGLWLEDLYSPLQIDATADQCALNLDQVGSITVMGTIADGVQVSIQPGSKLRDTTTQWLRAGLGTWWSDACGGIIAPQITALTSNQIPYSSPVIRVALAAPTDLWGFAGDVGRQGGNQVVLQFENDNCKLIHLYNSAGCRLMLEDGLNWGAKAGDVIVLTRVNSSGTAPYLWYQTGRHVATSDVANAIDTILVESDSGRIFSNGEASGTVIYTLPRASPGLRNARFTFDSIRSGQVLQVKPDQSVPDRFLSQLQGYVAQLAYGASLTVRCLPKPDASSYGWIVESATGTITYIAP